MKSMKIFAVALTAAIALPALAQTTSTPRIDERQDRQEQRIKK